MNRQPRRLPNWRAQFFEKDHKHVLQNIRALSCSADFRQRHFSPFIIKDAGGTKQELLWPFMPVKTAAANDDEARPPRQDAGGSHVRYIVSHKPTPSE